MENVSNYALLIDGENISPKYIESIFSIMSEYGNTPIRRIYGDFSSGNIQAWKEKCNEYSIKQIHHFNNTSGKNASDFSLVIDAMDILFKNEDISGYVIVSSDSDFTELVQRLKESCKKVIGMGEIKTPKALINACSEFKYLENYIKDESEEIIAKDTNEILTKIKEIICQNDGTILVSRLKEKLIQIYPDFDEKNYGYNQMNKFLHSFKELHVEIKNKTVCYVSYDAKNTSDKSLEQCKAKTIEFVKQANKRTGIFLSELGQKLVDAGIDYSNFGYSKLRKYIESIKEIYIYKNHVKLVKEKKEETK